MNQIYTAVHLHYQNGDRMSVACIPPQATGYQLTGDPRAVTCHKCKESAAYKTLTQQINSLPLWSQRG